MELAEVVVERVRSGDPRAFGEVFDQYHARLCRYLCSLTNDHGLAEDLTQDSFLKAYKYPGLRTHRHCCRRSAAPRGRGDN